jgi:hypothetical protein
MIKSGPAYRMSRANKVMLASYVDRHKRGEIKRTVIHADLCSQQFTPRSRDKNQPSGS